MGRILPRKLRRGSRNACELLTSALLHVQVHVGSILLNLPSDMAFSPRWPTPLTKRHRHGGPSGPPLALPTHCTPWGLLHGYQRRERAPAASQLDYQTTMALQIDVFRVEYGAGFSMPCINLMNRRGGAPRMLRWVCQRHMESLLFGRTDGGSSGPIWKLLNISGLGSSTLLCNRKAVNDGFLLETELEQVMKAFKQYSAIDVSDPSSLGRIRGCTILPLATAALICRQYGRSPASIAWLRAFAQPVPESWELHEQAEQDAANLELDLVLMDKLDDQSFEVENMSFREELTSMPAFKPVPDMRNGSRLTSSSEFQRP